jgi:hypothetical protein
MSSILPPEPRTPEPETEIDASSMQMDTDKPEKFQPSWRFLAAFGSLCILTLMAALDATSLSVALPVGNPLFKQNSCFSHYSDHG